jgi:N-acetylneuraminic acid mutarotase
MLATRKSHTATLLQNGKLLVVGGYGSNGPLSTAELYDPATGSWSATGSMYKARHAHSTTLLPDGKLLVAGGIGINGTLKDAEIFDPTTGLWTQTQSMAFGSAVHAGVLLGSGKVLMTGGLISETHTFHSRSELYNPANGIWVMTGPMSAPRASHVATVLQNGNVLISGGNQGGFAYGLAQLYNVSTGSWENAGSMNNARWEHAAVLLPDGKVFVVGGVLENHINNATSSAEAYDPNTSTWTPRSAMGTAIASPTATLLSNGSVLVAGGRNSFGSVSLAKIYYPSINQWYSVASMASSRCNHTSTSLSDGKVLIAGGTSSGNAILSSVEIYSATQPPPVVTAPSIASEPSGLNVTAGASATFSVSAEGTSPSYQWYKDGSLISGATASSYTIPSAQASDAGNYTVFVYNTAGSVISNAATLTVNSAPPPLVVTAPSIISQPASVSVIAGASASFSVSAGGTSPSYQWYKNGSLISGATASSYTIPSPGALDAGNYTVFVYNTAGSVISNTATLTVGPPPSGINSDLSTVSVPIGKLIPRFTITTNFGAKSFAAKGLPKGLKLNAKNGVISGKPTRPGTYTVTLTARKMKGKKVEQQATAKKVIVVY